MARITDYEQDDEKPFGVGTFKLDDGSEYYMDDPERARSVLDELYGENSARSQIGRESTDLALGQGLSQPAPYRNAVAGPGGGEEPRESRDDSANMSIAPTQSAGPDDEREDDAPQAGRQPPLSPEELDRQAQAQRVNSRIAALPTQKYVPGVDPERMQREGKPVDQHFMRKGALPEEVYNAQRAEREQLQASGNELLRTLHEERIAGQQADVERIRREALLMKVKNDADELAVQRKQQKYQDDRAWLEKDVESYYDKSKPDPDGGLRKARGPVGNLASAIAQFMGAYAAIISGSPNFANQILNKKIDQHVDAQVEEFRRGKMKRDGQLARMAERGMSIDQMKTALKLQQEKYIAKEGEMRVAIEGTRESKAAYQSLMLGREERSLALEQELQRQSLGETSVSGDIVQPRAGGMVPLTRKEQVEAAKLNNEFVDELEGGENARKERWRQEDRTDKQAERDDKKAQAQGKVTADEAKAETAWATIEAFGDATGVKKDPKTGQRVADQGLFSRDTLIAPGQRESVNDLTGQGKPIEAARRAAVDAVGRLQSQGAITKDEEENFKKMLGDEHATRAQIATNLNALRTLIQKRRSLSNQQQSSAAPSSWQSGDDEQ